MSADRILLCQLPVRDGTRGEDSDWRGFEAYGKKDSQYELCAMYALVTLAGTSPRLAKISCADSLPNLSATER